MRFPTAAIGAVLSLGAIGAAVQETPDEPLDVGDPAPTFVLNDQDGNLVSIGGESEEEEWVVLAFYPKALTGG